MPLSSSTRTFLSFWPFLMASMSRSCRRDAPLEQQHEQDVDDGLREEARLPLLLGIDAHDLVADVLVEADDVRVRVMQVVVGVLPRDRRGGRVPVPRRGVDVRVVHPVPLAVEDVVPDLHVLEDLGDRQPRGPEHPGRRVARGHQHDPRERGQAPVELDQRADVDRVTLAEVRADLVVDGLEGLADLVDLLRGEAVERVVLLLERVVHVRALFRLAPQGR
jgi:hypothetical protein